METDSQRTDEWYEARLGKATASNFSAIMARGKNGELAARKNYRAQLVSERLTATKADSFSSASMTWGTEYEDTAKLMYEMKSGNTVEGCGFYTHEKLQAGASPDGLIGDDGLVEIKCPNSATHIDTLKRQDIPPQYYWQVQGQMWVTGRKWCDFVSFDPRMPANAQLFIKRIERDDEAIKTLEAEVTTFLREVAAEVQFIETYKEV